MKKITSILAACLLLTGVLHSCKKSEFDHSVSTSIQITDNSRTIVNTNSGLKSTIYLTESNFVHEERGKIETKEYDNNKEVKSFTVERVWISNAKITDFSHVDIDPEIDALASYLTNVQLFIQDNHLVGDPLLLAEGTGLGYLDPLGVDINEYTANYPDFNLHLVSNFNEDPGLRSLLIDVNVGISYSYVTKDRKN